MALFASAGFVLGAPVSAVCEPSCPGTAEKDAGVNLFRERVWHPAVPKAPGSYLPAVLSPESWLPAPAAMMRTETRTVCTAATRAPGWCCERFVQTPQSRALPFHGLHERGQARRSGGGHALGTGQRGAVARAHWAVGVAAQPPAELWSLRGVLVSEGAGFWPCPPGPCPGPGPKAAVCFPDRKHESK